MQGEWADSSGGFPRTRGDRMIGGLTEGLCGKLLPHTRAQNLIDYIMHNLLADPLIRLRFADGATQAVSLPAVYEALTADAVAAFPALRPHQRHAWHAFLAQLGVIAIERSGQSAPPRTAAEWRALLRALTAGFGGDEPWQLIVGDPAVPAFMQCPAPAGFGEYRGRAETPDDLDILVTAKNHDVKRGVAVRGGPDDWMFALVNLQTMAGQMGRGNYPIARMNGGYSSRPCLGLAPAEGGLGAHLLHDMRRMLEGRDALLERHADYFRSRNGVALLWLEVWDGATALDLRRLDPYFIEICRRVRLRAEEGRIVAWTAASKTARVAAKEAHGNLGDFWTPIGFKDGKALSLSSVGFRYDRLAKLILDDSFDPPPAMQVSMSQTARWRVVARGVAGGQGKTDGYHERNDIAFGHRTTTALGRREGRDALAVIAKAQVDEIREVEGALRFGVAVAASGGELADLTKVDRMHANPYARRLDEAVDSRFFEFLERRFLAADDAAKAGVRADFARGMIKTARELLNEAVDTVPCQVVRRYRARSRAFSAFHSRLRRATGVFSDQPEIFQVQETDNVA